MSNIILLSKDEGEWANEIGRQRQQQAIDRGMRERAPGSNFASHMLGARGELAAAKWLGVPWPAYVGVANTKPNIEPDWDVRTRSHKSGSLIVRPRDIDTRRYLLIVELQPGVSYESKGWIRGADAKRPEWLGDPNGMGDVYWVPQKVLIRTINQQLPLL